MNKHLYSKLAAQNMYKNGKFYLPYLLAIIGTVAGFYIVSSLATDPAIMKVPRGAVYLQTVMMIGTIVVGFFATIFLFYTNSFLIKRRKRELGLYNILGMEKRHIATILAYESLYTVIIGIGGGLLSGIVLYKLVALCLAKVLRFNIAFGIGISASGIKTTAIFFAILLLLLLVANLMQIRKVKPIELITGGNVGEREPKARWLITLIGIGTLGGGYWVAQNARNGVEALAMYFIAVFLVIIGTYCLFTSVSIAVLKLMRKNKRLYYKPNHFISISGMLYRMKQNAVGLANICILSTMVMVMVSGTISLYLGTEEQIEVYCPSDIVFTALYDPTLSTDPMDPDALEASMVDILETGGISVESMTSSDYLYFSAGIIDGNYTLDVDKASISNSVVMLQFITAQEYAQQTGTEPIELNSDEVLIHSPATISGDIFTLQMPADSGMGDLNLHIAGHLDSFPAFNEVTKVMYGNVSFVVRDQTALNRIYNAQKLAYKDHASYMRLEVQIETDSPDELVLEKYTNLYDVTDQEAITGIRLDCRAANTLDAYSMNGSFLFLGIFLGFMFVIATVLIIYYKQVSEGYDDKLRFDIMQKVGLSRKEARRTINHQILIVFFLPLIVAAIHILMDFRMLSQLLSLFQLTNNKLTILCSIGTFAVFSIAYAVVYKLTARVYYRIVQ